MFYDVIGNEWLQINEKLELRLKNGIQPEFKIVDGKITVSLYGIVKDVDLKWLYLISYYNLNMPKGFENRIFDIDIIDINKPNKKLSLPDHRVVFKKPVYIDENKEFRLIARFPNYAISKNGKVLNLRNGKINDILSRDFNPRFYPIVSIVDQAKIYSSRERRVHILMAETWVPNDDWANKFIVDHINGLKSDFRAENLRWGSFKENNAAISDQGLSSQAYGIKIRDLDTGEVKEFSSLTKAVSYMGRSRINTKHTPLKYGRVWFGKKGRFEIMKLSDDRPWYYEDKDVSDANSKKVKVIVTKDNGEKLALYGLEEVLDKLLPNGPKLSTIDRAIKAYKKDHPDDKIEVILTKPKYEEKVYVAKNLDTSEVMRLTSMLDLSKKTHVHKSSIQKSVSNNGAYQYNGWVFKQDNHLPFAKVLNIENKPQEITIEDAEKVYTFNSLRSASEFLGVDKNTLMKQINSNSNYIKIAS